MLFSLLMGMFWPLRAPDDGTGDGGAGAGSNDGGNTPPPPNDPPSEKTFTQKEVDSREAQLRRRYDREIKELKQERDKQASEMDQLKADIESLKNTPAPQPPGGGNGSPPPPGDSSVEGRLQIMEQRFQRTEEELNRKIAEANQRAEEEKKNRLELERKSSLDKALEKAECRSKNMEMARRFFAPQIVWDTVDACWAFKLASGDHLVTIEEGIDAELPDEWKSPKNQGGAGTQGGMSTTTSRQQRTLQEEEQKLSDLKSKATANPSDRGAMMEFTRQKRKVQALRDGLKVPTVT